MKRLDCDEYEIQRGWFISMEDNKNKYVTTENICIDCGKNFLLRKCEYESFACRGWSFPKRCRACRKEIRKEKEERQNQIDAVKWKEKKEENQRKFECQLKLWNVKNYLDISPDVGNTLYILGNGFDMMHGVNSSYYSFRDSLGKTNSLRSNLEHFLTVEDIWADFEEALGHLDMQFFSSRMNADNWLDIMGAYEPDAGAAEFMMAAESATQVISDIVNELPRRFNDWVSKLTIGTNDRPLQTLFGNGKVLNFNYTEFVEELYGIPEENICYIHGCRRKEKGFPREKLILGHAPGASDSAFAERDHTHVDMRNPKRREMIYAVQDIVNRQLVECDAELTKDCKSIIKKHKSFFDSLKSTEVLITVGHSFSKVDWPYFAEIISTLSTEHPVQWYFGCFGLHDLENLDCMLKEFRIDRNAVSVFRTDIINVKKSTVPDIMHGKIYVPKAKILEKSVDGKWVAQTVGNHLQVTESNSSFLNYEIEMPVCISSAWFTSDGSRLFVISRDYPSGIFLFGLDDGKWELIGELEAETDYNFLTKSLDRILLSGDRITFVYNNRVRVHSLQDGRLIDTRQYRGARNGQFPGEDVTKKFYSNKRRSTSID